MDMAPDAKTHVVFIVPTIRSFSSKRVDLADTLVAAGCRITVLVPAGDMEEFAWVFDEIRYPYEVVELDRGGLNPLRNLTALKTLYLALRRLKPDVVFNYAVKPTTFGSIAARLAGVPRVVSMVTGAGYLFAQESSFRQKILRTLVLPLYLTAGRINARMIFQNPDDRDLFLEYRIVPSPERAVLVNGSGVDIDDFAYRPAPPSDTVRFIMISRLITEKGIAEYARAADYLHKKYPGKVECLHLGGVDPHSQNKIEDLSPFAAQGVNFLGFQTDVSKWLSESHVFVLPSYYPEGIPRSGLEALAIGRAVVSTNSPGCRELVGNGRNGFIVPPRNWQELADAMEKFLIEPELVNSMGAVSREIALERFDIRKVNAVMKKAILGESEGDLLPSEKG